MRKIFVLLILFFLSQCTGYSPIYSKKEINFYFDKIDSSSKNFFDAKIKQQLNNYKISTNDKFDKKKLDIIFNSNFNREVTSKDKKKNPDTFKMILKFYVTIINDRNEKFYLNYSESFNYNKSDRSEFEIKQYEQVIKDNLINEVIDNLISDILITIQK